MLRRLTSLLIGLSLAATAAISTAQPMHSPDALMLRYPDVSRDKIVFAYGGDLWTVPKEGGLARRLSSPKGYELYPKFSPDGKWIAFSGNYDGNTDIYVMPAEGGVPRRLTHSPYWDRMVEWYPSGQDLLFNSAMTSFPTKFLRIYKESIEGGMPEPLPLSYGALASFSPDGKRIAFQLGSREQRTWKRYRGGTASDIWIYDFDKDQVEKITDFEGTDAFPMWHGSTIYFLSDRGEPVKLNIWAHDVATGKTRQVTRFVEYDVKWPSGGPEDIVFENGGKLYVLDFKTETAHQISVQIPADLPKVRPQLKNASKNIESFSLSPSGKRALFGARGEVFTVPEKHGSVRDLTNTSGVAERYPAWSPDGKYVAYFSDKSGEYELYVRPSDGKGEEKRITTDGHTFRYVPVWSPDSKRIAFSDNLGNLFYVDVDKGKPRKVDKDDWSEIRQYSWSPDSRWLTYSKNMSNIMQAVMIYDTEKDKVHQVTSSYYENSNPVFGPEGKYLFFSSNRTFKPVYGDMDRTWIYPNSTNLCVATLRTDLESPLAPRSDEEEVKKEEGKEDEENGKDKKKEKESKKESEKEEESVEPVKIDFENFERRVELLPVDPGNFGLITAVKGKLVYQRNPAAGAAEPGSPSGTLMFYDLEEREENTIISGIDAYDVSADGKKVIYRSKSTYGIIDLAKGKSVGDGKIATEKMLAWIDPQEEWKQIYTDAWRIERDYFYDPNMHGVDWEAIRKRYAALLPYVATRSDLNYVIGEMIAELNSSHSYVFGGDLERPKQVPVGLLGCDFELDRKNNAYRIGKIYRGADWDVSVRSPLLRPGISVKEGDYLLAVNGRPLDTAKDPWAAFQGLEGELVTLTLNSSPSMESARDVVVKPISARTESRLRDLTWIEENRKKVEKETKGRVGYVYVPDTGVNGQNELVRQFTPQRNLDGLIIDERFNAGGQIPDRFIELLDRKRLNYWARRGFKDMPSPAVTNDGPKVMLINQWAGSGGDLFPYYFREKKLGPLVGMRTWGGLIGISGNPRLIDGGFVSAPTFAFWNLKGQWEVEGHGVDPDYEVENLPNELAKGHDAQLEKAIELVKKALEENPPVVPKRPPYVDRSGGTTRK